jgi:capsular polysaccharide biosynthesis protein
MADKVRSNAVARRVKKRLKTGLSTAALQAAVSARVEARTSLVVIRSRGGEPGFAARLANAFAREASTSSVHNAVSYTALGWSELMRMPSFAHSSAATRASWLSAALEAE